METPRNSTKKHLKRLKKGSMKEKPQEIAT